MITKKSIEQVTGNLADILTEYTLLDCLGKEISIGKSDTVNLFLHIPEGYDSEDLGELEGIDLLGAIQFTADIEREQTDDG